MIAGVGSRQRRRLWSAHIAPMHVVINHLRLREAVPEPTVEAVRPAMQLVVDAGALAARVAKVDKTHLRDTERYVAEVIASAGA